MQFEGDHLLIYEAVFSLVLELENFGQGAPGHADKASEVNLII